MMDLKKFNSTWLVSDGVRRFRLIYNPNIARGTGTLDYNDEKQFDISGINE
jgi:hypothetical protein